MDRTHKVGSQIRVFIVKSVIYKGGNNALSRKAQVPETRDVHRMFRILCVYQVPLLGECGVLDIQTLGDSIDRVEGICVWSYRWRGSLYTLAELLTV